ncbi:uncharacterized protein LOC116697851 isoform X2 [Etheostoma spectabile]|uniref:uncharacterized protein LOC116697851 isoform X2 n=1 Tax=Etheostoma spectabile TaxID=54343 RepID=UPI0013AFEA1D|nr:uncharacterized protein LOC116697851 isoform X2 [Etheostoma spectabile]
MTHFRGQIRGPHWGPAMDNMLIDFWSKHDCLFNSSVDSYYDKDLKTKLWTEFALSIGKPVSDVERRSRSLRTQYGRVLWHPERVSTFQQKMLREKLDFLRPYIVRRRSDSYLDEKFDDRDEDDEELETEGSVDHEMGSSFGSPLDADVKRQDLDDEPHTASGLNPASLHFPNPPPQVTDVMSLSCPPRHDKGSTDQPAQTLAPNTSKHNILNQFAEVMLADMHQIKDPMVLMRLRRDITHLVFKAVEEDVQRQCNRVPPMSKPGERVQVHGCSTHEQASSQTKYSWRQRFLKRRNKGFEIGRRIQRWEEMKHVRRMSRGQLVQPGVQQGPALEGTGENSSPVIIQASEIKRETGPPMVKIEEETL